MQFASPPPSNASLFMKTEGPADPPAGHHPGYPPPPAGPPQPQAPQGWPQQAPTPQAPQGWTQQPATQQQQTPWPQPPAPQPGQWPQQPGYGYPQPQPAQFTQGGQPVGGYGPVARQISQLLPRTGALLIDLFIVFMISIPFRIAVGFISAFADDGENWAGMGSAPMANVTSTGLIFGALEWVVIGLTWLLYSGFSSARKGAHRGETFGKQIVGITATTRHSGQPLTAGGAWKRAAAQTVLLFGLPPLGLLFDAATGLQPIGWLVGTILYCLMWALIVLPAVAGGERRMIHDRLAGTTVAKRGDGPPHPVAATARTRVLAGLLCLWVLIPAVSMVLLTQFDENSTKSIIDPNATSSISRGGGSSSGSNSASASAGGSAASSSPDGPTTGNSKGERIMAESDNADALAGLQELETDLADCMVGRSATDCRISLHLRFPELTFVDAASFDMSDSAEVAKHVGKFSALPDEDGNMFLYAYTDENRIWFSKIQEDGEIDLVDRGCMEPAADLCGDIYEWPGWNE